MSSPRIPPSPEKDERFPVFFPYFRRPDPRKVTNPTSMVNPAELPRFPGIGIDRRPIPHGVERVQRARARYFTVEQELSVS